MILRSVGIAGAIVVGLAVVRGAHPPAGDPRDRRHPDRPPRRPAGAPPQPTTDGAVGPPRAPRHAPPGRRPRADARAAARPRARRSSTSGSTPRTPRSSPPPSPRARPTTVLAREFGEGEFAPLVLAVRTTGDATTPGQPREALRLLAPAGRRPARPPGRARSSTSTRGSTLAQYQLLYGAADGPPDRFVATALGATTKGDLTAFTVYTPFGPNRDEGRALVRDAARPGGPLAPPAGITVLVGGGAADVDDVVVARLAPTSRGRRCSSS